MKKNSQVSVVVGKLAEPHVVETEEGERVKLGEWQGRAVWSYLRLVYGRGIDDKIKSVSEEDGREDYVYNLLQRAKQGQPLQFIIREGEVVAVATMNHLLLDPAQVYETSAKLMGGSLSFTPGINGGTVYLSGFAGIKTGVQIDGGDLSTRFAVRVAVFARVEMCFNPLSWLGVSGLGRFGVPGDYERVLRVKKISELEPRLLAAIGNASSHLDGLKARVEHAKTVSLSSPTATLLNGAMGLCYGLGGRTLKQVMNRFGEEDKTQYGLAMAQSWTAQHGKTRKTPEDQTARVPQSLSTMSGATILVDDIKTAEEKTRQWLGENYGSHKIVKELLSGRMP